ncbi:tetratricopeptide repeat protein [Mangrovimonas aestuarii]|uniref:tetratricopeptide repeat protein n=1 Tax=Mangrovimonas aestuarii TaxID=3018443 RepID=UPI002377E486|nr:tetratricopeptide repeat protein [Mangrovimonas aestuarii]
MLVKKYIFTIVFSLIMGSGILIAQIDFNKTPDDDLGNVSDAFQEHFFEALKQKGIENYDRAVSELLKCLEIDDSESVVYYELGKNYNQLKNFGAAEDALKKAVRKEPDNEWYLDELYDVYAQQDDYDKAIKTVKQLVKYHPDYKEDLAALYVKTERYNDALEILDELDEDLGISFRRDQLRNQIYDITGRKKDQIENLEERVEDHPDQESNYLALIYRYSENNEKEKAYETAKKLLEIKPNSQMVHLALYKFYLDDNKPDQAVESMKIVMKSPQIKPEAKMLVLSDFVKFVGDNPQYEPNLVEATTISGDVNSATSYVEVAQYFLSKGDKNKALKYYQEALNLESDNFGVIRNILLLQIDLKQFEEAHKGSGRAIIKYPSQPVLYLINGVALNNLNEPQKAITTLEMGLDYIIDDAAMEADFYQQLSEAHTLLNNIDKAKQFNDKAKQLQISN